MAQVGDTLGEFELRREIGRGAMGTVFEAHQASLDRTVAVKVLKGMGDDPTWVQRFRGEAAQAARLSHRGILPIYAFGETGDDHWYAMELIQGEDLGDRLAREKQIPPREAAALVREAARALHHAHEQGVVHRDVKPANIMVQPDGRVVVADFGLSKSLSSGGLTTTGTLIGTPYYMSPEVCAGSTDPGPATDVYGLGVTLYELVDGKPPFLADNAVALIRKIAEEKPPALAPRGTNASSDVAKLDKIVRRAMAKKPEERYATAEMLAEDLDHFLEGDALARSGTIQTGPRRRWVPWLVGALLVAAGALGAVLALSSSNGGDGDGDPTPSAADVSDLEREIHALLENDDIEGAQALLAKRLDATDAVKVRKSAGVLFLASLLSPRGKAQRDLVDGWADGKATLTLKTDPPDAAVSALHLSRSPLAYASLPAAANGPREIAGGLWRFVATAPGHMTSVATIALVPKAHVTVTLRLPKAGEVPAVHYAGVWAPAGIGGAATAESVLPAYTLGARAASGRDVAGAAKDGPTVPRDDPTPFAIAQAQRYVEHVGGRLPSEGELKHAFLPALLAMLRRSADKTQVLAALEKEGRQDLDMADARFWARAPSGKVRAVGLTGTNRAAGARPPRRGKRRKAAQDPSRALILVARSP